MGTHKKLYKFRKFLMYFWLLVMPVTFNWMSPVLIVMAGFEGYISLSFVIFAIWFLSSFFVGRAYCAYGCQWGASQELLSDAIPKKLDPNKKNRNRKIKYGIFVIWIFFLILGPLIGGGYYNGLNLLYPNEPTDFISIISFDNRAANQLFFYFGILGSVAILFTLVGGGRSFCNYACPMGVLGILGTKLKNILKYPSLHLEVNSEKCTECKTCTKNCVMSLEVHDMVLSGDMYHSDCILCGSCVLNCPQDVISYSWKWKNEK
jgi:polyferredoxin